MNSGAITNSTSGYSKRSVDFSRPSAIDFRLSADTTPAMSEPRICGSGIGYAGLPCRIQISRWFNAHAFTCTSTSSPPIVGIGIS